MTGRRDGFDRFWQGVALLASVAGLALGMFGDPSTRTGAAGAAEPACTCVLSLRATFDLTGPLAL